MQTNKSRNFLFIMFGALYFTQGVIQAYQLNFFKPHLDGVGIDADRIATLAGLALLPFMLKWIFGIISDRINFFGLGYRVPYMVLGIVVCALGFGVAYFINPASQYTLFAGMILIGIFAMALYDTTADALAVDIIPKEDYNRVQSVMTGGRAAGFIILSLVFGIVAARLGYPSLYLLTGVILLLPLIMVFQVKEPTEHTERESFEWGAFKILVQPNFLLYIFFLILAWTTFQGLEGLITFYMSKELLIGPEILGRYGMLKGVGMVIGAFLVGGTMERFGHRTSAIATISLVTIAGFIFSRVTELNAILIISVLWGVVVAFHWTVYSTYSMTLTDKRIAGSMFAILLTVGNIGMGIGEALATGLVDDFGFGGVFLGIAVINLALIPLLLLVFRRFSMA